MDIDKKITVQKNVSEVLSIYISFEKDFNINLKTYLN